MSCRMTGAISFLVVALLFSSLLTLHLPTARARHVAMLKADDGLDIRGRHDADVVSGAWGKKAGRVTSAGGGSRPGTVEMRVATRHRDAAAEMHDMLRRDYAWKVRRRSPIHNDEPLQEDEP